MPDQPASTCPTKSFHPQPPPSSRPSPHPRAASRLLLPLVARPKIRSGEELSICSTNSAVRQPHPRPDLGGGEFLPCTPPLDSVALHFIGAPPDQQLRRAPAFPSPPSSRSRFCSVPPSAPSHLSLRSSTGEQNNAPESSAPSQPRSSLSRSSQPWSPRGTCDPVAVAPPSSPSAESAPFWPVPVDPVARTSPVAVFCIARHLLLPLFLGNEHLHRSVQPRVDRATPAPGPAAPRPARPPLRQGPAPACAARVTKMVQGPCLHACRETEINTYMPFISRERD